MNDMPFRTRRTLRSAADLAAAEPRARGKTRGAGGGGGPLRRRHHPGHGRPHRPRRSRRPDRPPVRAGRGRAVRPRPGSAPTPSATMPTGSSEGLIHRYPDRVLLKLVSVCPVYCRFCFRRETVGQAGSGLLSPEALAAALGYIRAHDEIWEVILSGGDPLIAAPRRLAALAGRWPPSTTSRSFATTPVCRSWHRSGSRRNWFPLSPCRARQPGWRSTPTTRAN